MQHVLSVEQFSPTYLDEVFADAVELRQRELAGIEERRWLQEQLAGRQACSLFYEPSTRTRLSFEAAAEKMGMGVVSTENALTFSSAAKGETIEDTIRVLDGYHFDVIVLRHHEEGTAAKAATVSEHTPIINAGDGKGEHPTQALLDMFTIRDAHQRLDNLNVVIGGDLRNGRTARSLAKLLAEYRGNKLTFVSLPEFAIGEDIKQYLASKHVNFSQTDAVEDAFRNADVVYWTRLQRERLQDGESDTVKGFVLDPGVVSLLPETSIIMHPLPRVDEIAPEVDADPRARYFQQASNGLYVRMALLKRVIGASEAS